MNDHQTLGGNPKLGCVTRLDLNGLSQAMPDSKTYFSPSTREQATRELIQFAEFFGV